MTPADAGHSDLSKLSLNNPKRGFALMAVRTLHMCGCLPPCMCVYGKALQGPLLEEMVSGPFNTMRMRKGAAWGQQCMSTTVWPTGDTQLMAH